MSASIPTLVLHADRCNNDTLTSYYSLLFADLQIRSSSGIEGAGFALFPLVSAGTLSDRVSLKFLTNQGDTVSTKKKLKINVNFRFEINAALFLIKR